jgi:protein-disulfide isomerase/uncharacterized membrane protein
MRSTGDRSVDEPSPPAARRVARRQRLYLWLAAAFAGGGLGSAVELTRIHVDVHTDPKATSFCSIARAVNCLNVAESPYSIFLGVPVSVWAIIGELALLLAAVTALATKKKIGSGVLFWGASIGVAVGAWLSYVSAFRIGSLCILCSVLEAANIVILVMATLHFKARSTSPDRLLLADMGFAVSRWRLTFPAFVLGVAGLIALIALYPPYWKTLEPHGPGGLPHGVTGEGHAWIGATRPEVVIEEFTDFQCPFCRTAHARVRALVAAYPTSVRLVHRDFPLDHHCNPSVETPYHRAACDLALAARCAGRQRRFWEMADLIFERGKREGGPNPEALAFRLGLDRGRFETCMKSDDTRRMLRRDIEEGLSRHLEGTPAYFIDGQRISGWPTAKQIESRLDRTGRMK